MRLYQKIIALVLFGVAMGYFEAAVVVYLRELYYPGGFCFPLMDMPGNVLAVELGREAASLLMLVSVAILTGKRCWERLGVFLATFGIWDISYYIWLKVTLGWPLSLTEPDILFLIPRPWIGPVIAPVLISIVMIGAGFWIMTRYDRGGTIAPRRPEWVLALAGTGSILYSFMARAEVTPDGIMPCPYKYWLLCAGLVGYLAAFGLVVYRTSRY